MEHRFPGLTHADLAEDVHVESPKHQVTQLLGGLYHVSVDCPALIIPA
jgi:hypothetical protein